MFRNVLVGVDGRQGGRDAIALAQRLLEPDGARLTLAHVRAGELHPLHTITPGLLEEERTACEELLVQERDRAGVEAELVSIVAMSPGRGLHQQAERQAADLLVVGSCARGVFGRAMLGNDTRGALNGTPCAVAVAARGYGEHPWPPARIGAAYNGSRESRAALACAREIARPTHASVQALEVVSIPSYAFTGMMPAMIGESIETALGEAKQRMAALPGVEGRAVYGLAGEELAAFGDQVDILVVGSRSYGAVRRLVVGSTTEYLERHARCSLLVLPRSACGEDSPGENAGAAAASVGAAV